MTTESAPHKVLRIENVPAEDAPFEAIARFGYTFNGYEELGSFEACAEVANSEKHDTIRNLRACLFFEQRRFQHMGSDPRPEDQAYQRGLVAKIRERLLSGLTD